MTAPKPQQTQMSNPPKSKKSPAKHAAHMSMADKEAARAQTQMNTAPAGTRMVTIRAKADMRFTDKVTGQEVVLQVGQMAQVEAGQADELCRKTPNGYPMGTHFEPKDAVRFHQNAEVVG